jgi:enoyl-CoA hydratase/carnithine racemase
VSDELVRERRGNVLVARLDRPEARNALDAALIRGIGEAMNDADADPDVRAVVLTGTGDRAFCAGMDRARVRRWRRDDRR